MQFSRFSDIYVVLLMLVCSLENLEMDLLVMLILILLVIWILGGLSQVMFSPLVAVLSWKARLQATIALSTTEDEYMVVSESTKEAIWLIGLYSELCEISSCVTIHCDS